LVPTEVHYMEKNSEMFSSEIDLRKKDMDILDDMGVRKLSATVFFKVNYSFKMFFEKDFTGLADIHTCRFLYDPTRFHTVLNQTFQPPPKSSRFSLC